MLERLFIIRYLFSKSRGSMVRTMAVLSIGGIGIGILAMVVVLSVMSGFDEAIKTRLLGVEPHIVITTAGNLDTTVALQEKVTRIMKIVGEKGTINRFQKQDVIIRTVDGIFSGAVAQGAPSDLLGKLAKKVRHSVEVSDNNQGAMATAKNESAPIDFDLSPKEIAVGVDLARSLGVFEGDEVMLVAPETLLLPSGEMPIFEKMKVRALVRTDVPDIDAHQLFYNVKAGLKHLQDSASLEEGLEIRLDNPDRVDILEKAFKKTGITKIQTWQEMNAALFYSLKMEKTLMGVFLALTVLVSSFSIIAVLVLLVTEKRMDVGILKAIGASQQKIRQIFVSIGLALGLFGIIGGAAVGLLICWILKTYPIIKLPDIYYDTSIPVHVEYGVIFGVVVLGTLLTLAGTVWPAWKISKFDPIQAIRHDG